MKSNNNEILPQGYKMTELGPLPEEWEVVRLGDYCNIFSGYAFKSDDFCNDGVLVVKIGNLQNGSIVLNDKESFFPREKINDDISKFILNEGDILMALTGATTGKIALVPKSVNGALLNQRVGKFSIYNSSLYSSFAKYYFMTDEFQDTIKKNILQSAQGNISPKQIETFKLPLPPLPEQQKIAAVLSAVQEAKEKTRAVIDATKALKKSMMKHLFTYGPVPPEETENVPLKETEIGKVPEDWEVVKLGEVVREKITDGTHKTPQYIENGIPFITITNLVNGKIDFSKCRFISEEEHNFLINRCKPEKDDVLLSKVGTLGLTAKICEKDNFSIFVQLALIKPKKEIINSDFLTYMLNSISIQNQIEIKSSQSTMKYIGVEKISQLQIPLPPLPVQQKIASILSAIDAKIEAEENKKKSLEKLFKTLLHNLMTAKIRVNHLEIKV